MSIRSKGRMVADITIRAVRQTHKSALSQKRSATHPHTQRWLLPSARSRKYSTRRKLGLLDRQFGKSTIAAVGHRIVHGGIEFTESVVLDDRKTTSLHRLAPLAPLHQPHNLLGVRAARRAFPEAAAGRLFRYHLPPCLAARTLRAGHSPLWSRSWRCPHYGPLRKF